MKPNDLKITDWQSWLEKFYAANPKAISGAAFRIENTPFTSARYAGGMIYNGDKYTYFEPIDERKPKNRDGTPYVAWLMVRADFLRWVTKELRKGASK